MNSFRDVRLTEEQQRSQELRRARGILSEKKPELLVNKEDYGDVVVADGTVFGGKHSRAILIISAPLRLMSVIGMPCEIEIVRYSSDGREKIITQFRGVLDTLNKCSGRWEVCFDVLEIPKIVIEPVQFTYRGELIDD